MKRHDNAMDKGPAEKGRELESRHPARRKRDDGADIPLPHETDQSVGSQDEDGPRKVGEQAHEDLERGPAGYGSARWWRVPGTHAVQRTGEQEQSTQKLTSAPGVVNHVALA